MQEFSRKFALYASVLSTPLALSTLLTYLRFMHLLANSALLLTLVLSVSEARYASDHEKPGYKFSQNCKS